MAQIQSEVAAPRKQERPATREGRGPLPRPATVSKATPTRKEARVEVGLTTHPAAPWGGRWAPDDAAAGAVLGPWSVATPSDGTVCGRSAVAAVAQDGPRVPWGHALRAVCGPSAVLPAWECAAD